MNDMDRVVNIYADGALAYTGFLSRAAVRLRLEEHEVEHAIIDRLNLKRRQPRENSDGDPILRARCYLATWRDAPKVDA
jgi:hypothetical protein